MTDIKVKVTEAQPIRASISEPVHVIKAGVTVPGPAGPAGPAGERGPIGPPGDSELSVSYTYSQLSPSAEWVIDHPLSFLPGATVIDFAGTEVEGGIQYVGGSRVIITFQSPFSGTALLS